MADIFLEELRQRPVRQQRVEFVERKGLGHPDSICDAIMEEISVALSQAYNANFGKILHHNIDKGLLVAGQTEPQLGGGSVLEPMRLVFGDRATMEYRGKSLDVDEIAVTTAKKWIAENLRFVDPDRHIIFQNELKPGSPELTDLFQREEIGANDTSAAVGYAPLTETERLVKIAERYVNAPPFKQKFPMAGEDVKVMGYRRDRELVLTVAMAMVDRFIDSEKEYFRKKEEIQSVLQEYLLGEMKELERIDVRLNNLDDRERGEAGMYLTVLGTSAEGGDCGQVGRGNKVNGVIALNRPMSTEAAAGKNPVSHVGKIYTLLTHHIAEEIHSQVSGIEEIYIWLGSQIGDPLNNPAIASAQIILKPGASLSDVDKPVRTIFQQEMAQLDSFTQRLSRGEYPVL